MRPDLLESRGGRKVLFALLYLSEGAPIGFVWLALPALLRMRQVPVEQITGLTALLVLPWSLKFLWAPLVDFLRGPRLGFRGWILCMQGLMAATLLPLLWLDPVEHLGAWRAVLLLHAVCAATQDVAVDALAIRTVPAAERGSINGMMQLGLLTGRSLFGGGVLLVHQALGFRGVVGILAACILAAATPLAFTRVPPEEPVARGHWLEPLRAALRRRTTWLGLAFALTSGAAFEVVGALVGPLLVDRGMSQSHEGLFLALPVVLVTAAGGILGGRLADRFGRRRTAGAFLLGFVAAVALLAVADLRMPGSMTLRLALLTSMYLFVGLFTVASYALFMDLTDPRIGATQFSAFMGATNGCESWSGWAGGRIAERAGYSWSFLVMCVVSLLSLLTLRGLRRTWSAEQREIL